MAAKRKKPPAKKPTARARPSRVEYITVPGGRRNKNHEPADLFARIEVRDGVTSVSLGSGHDKLQIRVTKKALATVLAKMA